MSVSAVDPAASPLVGASPWRALARFFRHAFRLRGRASRSEYWWWVLSNVVVLGVCQLPNSTLLMGTLASLLIGNIPITVIGTPAPSSPVAAFSLICAGVWMLVTLIPGVTVLVRRLHDSDLSGLWAFVVLLPFGSLVVLGLAIRRPRPEGARFDV